MKLKQLLLLFLLLTCSLLLGFSLFAQAPTAGLVGYWPMNGNYNAGPGTSVNGSNVGSTATTNKAGVANSAMSFSNPGSTVSQYATHPVTAGLNFTAAQDFSIAFLFYLPSWIHTLGFYDNNLNYNGVGIWMWDIGSRVIQFNFRNGSVASTALQLGTWYHVTCVKSGTALRIYINGVLNATGTTGTQTPIYSFPGKFGTMSFNGQTPAEYNGYNGKLDEFRIYNRVLTATEIYQMASQILPLKLGDLTASKKSSGIQLNWETLSEQNVSHFEIERSTDGTVFGKIGNCAAKGNSNEKTMYSFLDASAVGATVFYRLKMVDLDGAFTYSRVITIKNDNSLLTLSLFPNPVKGVLQVQLPSTKKQTTQLHIIDAIGRNVYSRSVVLSEGPNAISIPVHSLAPGIYQLVSIAGEDKETRSFIKQ